jgi:peptidoglycan/LPS O-acetylase OafA/YrhL
VGYLRVSSSKIADIEILRAVAVTFVVIHHSNGNLLGAGQLFSGYISDHLGGWVGVDLFFAISGFVIARTLVPTLSAARDSVQFRQYTYKFWLKRALRLLPSAWLWLAIILCLTVFFNESGVFGTLHANIWATVAGVFNFANFRFADAFMSYPYGTSFVYWSLSLEEQFYLLLPLVIFISKKYLPMVLLVIIAMQLPQQRDLLGMAVRSDAVCLGVMIALFTQTSFYKFIDPRGSRLVCAIYFVFLTSCLCLLPFLAPLTAHLSFQVGLIAVLSAGIVLCCSYDADLLKRIPGSRLLVWLGGRSYAIYLIHIPSFYLIRELAYRNDISLQQYKYSALTGAIILILLLAEANYRLIERPVARYSHRFSAR